MGGIGPIDRLLRARAAALAGLVAGLVLGMCALPATSSAFTPPGAFGGGQYYVYVCNAAADVGYSGDLNRFFKSNRIHYTRQGGDPWGDTVDQSAPGDWNTIGATNRDTQPKRNWELWDTCSSGGGNQIGIRHDNRDVTISARTQSGLAQGPGGTGWAWAGGVDQSAAIRITRVWLEDDIKAFFNRMAPATEGSRKKADAEWKIGGDEDAPAFRGCGGWGMWTDANVQANGFKNGDNPIDNPPGSAFGLGSDIFRPAEPMGNQHYRYGPAREYMGLMRSAGDQDSTCHIRGGNSKYEFGSRFDAYKLSFRIFCNNRNPDSRNCRGTRMTIPANMREQGATRQNAINHGTSIRTNYVRVLMTDTANPTVRVTGGILDAGGAVVGDYSHNKETLRFTGRDDSGIRAVRVYVDGVRQPSLTRNFSDLCDHRFPVPCREARGGNGPNGTVDMSAILFDADSLRPGRHTIEVELIDGSGRSSRDIARFRTVEPPILEEYCKRQSTSGAAQDDCSSDLPTDDNSGPRRPRPPVIAPVVAPPTVGTSVFTYDMAFNSRPSATAMDSGNCRVIEHVASGAGGSAELSPRELNQVISITINLRGYVSTGATLGQQDLRATFAMPSRNTPRYRSALGCAV